jgi:hypothetical protein
VQTTSPVDIGDATASWGMRVTDGARTRDLRGHIPALCQLSYGHQGASSVAQTGGGTGGPDRLSGMAPVAQLDRADGFYPSGCAFESCRGRRSGALSVGHLESCPWTGPWSLSDEGFNRAMTRRHDQPQRRLGRRLFATGTRPHPQCLLGRARWKGSGLPGIGFWYRDWSCPRCAPTYPVLLRSPAQTPLGGSGSRSASPAETCPGSSGPARCWPVTSLDQINRFAPRPRRLSTDQASRRV